MSSDIFARSGRFIVRWNGSNWMMVRRITNPEPIEALVISKGGCYMTGNKIHHPETCTCDEEYEQLRDSRANW